MIKSDFILETLNGVTRHYQVLISEYSSEILMK